MDAYLTYLYQNKSIEPLDLVFARTVMRLGQCADPWVGLAAAMVSRAAGAGHVCLALDTALDQAIALSNTVDMECVQTPDEWRHRLAGCAAVGSPGDFRPLILDGTRLYLHRYWTYEHQLARAILNRCAAPPVIAPGARLEALLKRLFPGGNSDQQRAARLAATQRFGVVSGGPGTGKTFTVARTILLLQSLDPEAPPRIQLAAPTGKAAARLQESVQAVLEETGALDGPAPPVIPEAHTLHRLLGYTPHNATFRYHADHPLPADVVIVDEASMIDLSMMHHLVMALDRNARLILLGDKDQLASVAAGAVLGDICHGVSRPPRSSRPPRGRKAKRSGAEGVANHLRERIIVLDRSYRFDPHGGIGALSRAVNSGDGPQVLALLNSGDDGPTVLHPLTNQTDLAAGLEGAATTAFAPLFDGSDAAAALAALGRFKILCAVRQGPYGVAALNDVVAELLRKHGRIPTRMSSPSPWYAGRPVIISRNDYVQGLYNGDVGVATAVGDAPGEALRVVFPATGGGFKSLAPHQLPAHETVYAMSVHKSQGSEFDHVVLVLPDFDSPLLTRELIYTAVTRARRTLRIWAPPHLLALAVARRIQRQSGLREALWPE